MNQKQLEKYLGPRGEHYHGGKGDAGCFSVCPVWDWDLREEATVRKFRTVRIEGDREVSQRLICWSGRLQVPLRPLSHYS